MRSTENRHVKHRTIVISKHLSNYESYICGSEFWFNPNHAQDKNTCQHPFKHNAL